MANRVALVTGGGVNIGKAIALRLAQDGLSIAVAGTNLEALQATAAAVRQNGVPGLALHADVADEAQVTAMVEDVLSSFGRIDVLVNNAGIIGPTAPVHQVERVAWDETLAVNLTGAFLCARAVLPAMLRQRSGRIINISSVAGKIAYPLRSPYAVSKWGLIGLTMTLAKEVGEHGIQVNAICPGPVQGERMRRVIEERARELGTTYEEVERKYYLPKTALGRMVTEDEVAALAGYLASDAAAGITGQAIDVAAGWGL